MSTVQNLWGELPLADVSRTPAAILREQATQLTSMTNGILEGNVSTGKSQVVSRKNTPFVVRLNIIVPTLENYIYGVIRCYHSVLLYPVSVIDLTNDKEFLCDDEEVFIETIGNILSSASVHKAISALLAQSKSESPLGL